MRLRLTLIAGGLALTALAAADSDTLTRIRADGATAWTSVLAGDAKKDAPGTTPLAVPAWFARFPDTKIPLTPNGSFDLAAAKGKVVLLDYWASWCAPCMKELPHLQQLHVSREGKGFIAVAINADEDAPTAADSAKRLGLTMKIGINDPAVYRTLGVRALPTVLIIDKQGRLRARWDGYRTGLEKEIDAKVDALLADDPAGTTREMASVLSGGNVMHGLWFRDLPGPAEGVVGLPAGAPPETRVVASSGDELLAYDAAGAAIAKLKSANASGRLLDFGMSADGTRELLGYRPGATSVGVIALRSGAERAIAVPAPIVDLAVATGTAGDGRRVAIATLSGAAMAGPSDAKATLLKGGDAVRAVSRKDKGFLGLAEDGTIRVLDGGAPWTRPVAGSARVVAAGDDAIVGPRGVIAAVSGSFLKDGGRQLAVATYAGHLVLIDDATGHVLFDSVWTGIHDLGMADLDGDGRDDLLVAAGRSIVALGSGAR